MAAITVKVPQGFPVGTTLSAYVDRVGDIDPQGPPVSTCVVQADSSVTVTGLAYGIPYQVGFLNAGKWRSFLVEIPPPNPTSPEEVRSELIAHEIDTTDVHGIPDTGNIGSTLPDGSVTLPKLGFDVATQAELDAVAQGVGAPNTRTATYTLALSDAGKVVEMNAAGATTVNLPTNAAVAFPVGTVITVRRIGAGAVTLHPNTGAVQRNRIEAAGTSDRAIANQWSEVSYCKRATDEWVLVGDIA